MSVPVYSFIHSNIQLYNKVKPALTANCKNDTLKILQEVLVLEIFKQLSDGT